MKILIVDDTKLSRAMLVKRLPANIKESAELYQGVNGQDAVNYYKELNPDIVFLDLTMPVMDGFEALSQIKAHDPDALVYIVTADIQAKAKEKVLSIGAAGVENKPINEERLQEIFSSIEKEK